MLPKLSKRLSQICPWTQILCFPEDPLAAEKHLENNRYHGHDITGWEIDEEGDEIDESFVMLTDAYNANPSSHYILDSLAWAYYKKKDFVKAAELMEEVIDMVPGEAISLDHLGDIYFSMNNIVFLLTLVNKMH